MAEIKDIDHIDIDEVYDQGDSKTLIMILQWSRDVERRKQAAYLLGHIARYKGYSMPSEWEDLDSSVRIKDHQATPALIRALKNDAGKVRYAAIEAMRMICDPNTVTPLIDVLDNDSDPIIQVAAAGALSSLGCSESHVLYALVKALGNEDVSVRKAVASCLRALTVFTDLIEETPGLSDSLVEALDDEEASVRYSVGSVLCGGSCLLLNDLLLEKLEDKRSVMRSEAARTLGRLLSNSGDIVRSEKALLPLANVLPDKDGEVRLNAAEALASIIKGITWEYERGNDYVRYTDRKVWSAAQFFGDWELKKVVGYLITMLEKDEKKQRSVAARALGELKSEMALEALIKALEEDEDCVRLDAVKALGKLKNPRAVEPLIKELHSKSHLNRDAAVFALGRIKDERAIDPLIQVLKNDDSKLVRITAVKSLGSSYYKFESVKNALIEALKDSKWLVRREAAEELAWMEDPKVLEPLAHALRDKETRVRKSAAWALGEFGGKQAAGLLLEAIKTEKYISVQCRINEALSRIKEINFIDFSTKKKS